VLHAWQHILNQQQHSLGSLTSSQVAAVGREAVAALSAMDRCSRVQKDIVEVRQLGLCICACGRCQSIAWHC
jgi:hypothetical protein